MLVCERKRGVLSEKAGEAGGAVEDRMLLVIQLDMGQSLLKMLMLVAMRYYYIFHFDRKFSAA